MSAGAPARAGRREWVGLGVIALPCLLYSMDLTVLNLALPHLSADLRPTGAQLLWIVDIYGFVLAGMLIPMGHLGDRIGRRRLLMMGAAAFGAASVLAAFSRTAAMLIAARAILGVAGATLAPSTLSLIRNMFADPGQRTTAIGIWITSYSAGGALGPLIGGVLLDHFWWGSVFLIGVPVMLLLLVAGRALLPEFRDPRPGRMDFESAAMSLGAILLVIHGAKRMAQGGVDALAFASVAAGILVGVLFVRRQRILETPLVDLALLRSRAFSASLAAYTLATFVAFGFFLFVGQYLQVVEGLSASRAGVVMLPIFSAFIVGSLVVPRLARHMRPSIMMAWGLVVAATGFTVAGLAGTGHAVALFIAGCTVYCLGLAPVFTLTTDLIVGAAPPERAGTAAALSETGSELGGALGIAVLGSIGTAIFRHGMLNAVPAGIAPVAGESARSTLGGAAALAAQLPRGAGDALTAAAHAAFRHSLLAAALLSAASVLAMALVVARMIREPAPAA